MNFCAKIFKIFKYLNFRSKIFCNFPNWIFAPKSDTKTDWKATGKSQTTNRNTRNRKTKNYKNEKWCKKCFQHLQNIQSCSSWFCIIEDLRSLLGLLTWLSCNPWSIMSLSSSRTGKKSLPISIIKICIPKCQHSCSKKIL